MALVNRSFSVNITPGAMPPIVHVSEYDVGRAYTVSILDEHGNTFTIPTGTTASIEGTLNGSVGFTQSATVSNNQVSFTLSESMTAYSGKAWCKIKLTQNSQPIQTCAFVLAVDRAGVEADTVIGAPGFEEQIAEAAGAWLEDQGFTSPTVDVTEITGGHRVTVTDYQSSETFDVMDGEDTGVEVDSSLSVDGKAADSGAVGRELNTFQSSGGAQQYSPNGSVNLFFTTANPTMRSGSPDDCRTAYFSCMPNMTYTIAKSKGTTTFAVGWTTAMPASGVSVNNVVRDVTASQIEITAGSNAAYIVVYYSYNESNPTEVYDSLSMSMSSTQTLKQKIASIDASLLNLQSQTTFEKAVGEVLELEGVLSYAFIKTNVTPNELRDSGQDDCRVAYFACDENSAYTVTKSASNAFKVGYTTSTPTKGVAVYGVISDASKTTIDIETPSGAQYIVVQYAYSDSDADSVLRSIVVGPQGGGSVVEQTLKEKIADIEQEIEEIKDGSGGGSVGDLVRDVPQNRGVLNAYKRAHQLIDLPFTLKAPVPAQGGASMISAGAKKGMLYSELIQTDTYVGFQVSLRTFMTAVNNPYSVLYTENCNSNHSQSGYGKTYLYNGMVGSYYGTVCSDFVNWVLGMPPWYSYGYQWMIAKGVFERVYDNTGYGVQLMDVIHTGGSTGHVRIVTDIYRDARGTPVRIHVSDSVPDHVRNSIMSPEQVTAIGGTLLRYKDLYKSLDYEPSPFVAVEDETIQTPYQYNDDICPYLGDYCAIASNDDMFINYVKGSYTQMQLYKGDSLIQTISLPSSYNATHSVNVTSYLNGGGMYKARLVGSGIASDYCYFEVVDVNVTTSLDGGNLTVTWSSANAPVSHLRLKSQVGSVRATYVLSDAEKQAGSATFDYQQVLSEQFGIGSSTTKLYARVYFKGQYGMVHADEDTGIV